MQKIRPYALILLFMFIMSAVLPFFAANTLPSHNTSLSSIFGEKILICSGDGFKWVTLADLQSGKEKPQKNNGPHGDHKCPFCFAASHGLNILPPSPVIARQDDLAYIKAPTYNPFLSSSHFTSPLGSRAPPVFFIS